MEPKWSSRLEPTRLASQIVSVRNRSESLESLPISSWDVILYALLYMDDLMGHQKFNHRVVANKPIILSVGAYYNGIIVSK